MPGDKAKHVAFLLNGEQVSLDVDPDAPVLVVLRNEFKLSSPRYGCGNEQCGCCVVLLNGKSVYACTTKMSELDGGVVTTVEGLGESGELHALQQAFIDHNAAQCGYCSSGILIRAAELLDSNPDPDRHDIQVALQGHLCRCGAHNRVIQAITAAARVMRGD